MLRELVMVVAADDAEPFGDALLEAGALAVTVEDAEADTADEAALFGEPGTEPVRLAWNRNRVIAQCGAGDEPRDLIARAAAACGIVAPEMELREVPEDDWVARTQAQFPPQRVGRRLWIVPTWHEPPEPDALVIRLDPGVAFGTGTHPTTRLCLEWLDAHVTAGMAMLDYGCGSGILAIAAARLGAHPVHATDVDAQALQAARANADANELDVQCHGPGQLPARRYDIVVANILANPLKLLAELLVARCAEGGWLVLAGLLDRQVDEMQARYRQVAPRLRLQAWRALDGWTCLAGRLPSAARDTRAAD